MLRSPRLGSVAAAQRRPSAAQQWRGPAARRRPSSADASAAQQRVAAGACARRRGSGSGSAAWQRAKRGASAASAGRPAAGAAQQQVVSVGSRPSAAAGGQRGQQAKRGRRWPARPSASSSPQWRISTYYDFIFLHESGHKTRVTWG